MPPSSSGCEPLYGLILLEISDRNNKSVLGIRICFLKIIRHPNGSYVENWGKGSTDRCGPDFTRNDILNTGRSTFQKILPLAALICVSHSHASQRPIAASQVAPKQSSDANKADAEPNNRSDGWALPSPPAVRLRRFLRC